MKKEVLCIAAFAIIVVISALLLEGSKNKIDKPLSSMSQAQMFVGTLKDNSANYFVLKEIEEFGDFKIFRFANGKFVIECNIDKKFATIRKSFYLNDLQKFEIGNEYALENSRIRYEGINCEAEPEFISAQALKFTIWRVGN